MRPRHSARQLNLALHGQTQNRRCFRLPTLGLHRIKGPNGINLRRRWLILRPTEARKRQTSHGAQQQERLN